MLILSFLLTLDIKFVKNENFFASIEAIYIRYLEF